MDADFDRHSKRSQQALLAVTTDLVLANDSRSYDIPSFNSGCHAAIQANGDPANANGEPQPQPEEDNQ